MSGLVLVGRAGSIPPPIDPNDGPNPNPRPPVYQPPPPPPDAKRRFRLITPRRPLGLLITDRANGYSVKKGVRGLTMPPVALQMNEGATNGSTFGQHRFLQRTIDMLVRVEGRTRQETQNRRAALMEVLDNSDGTPTRIQIEYPDRPPVWIEAYYAGGAEGDTSGATPLYETLPLSFVCPDPFFTDAQDIRLEWRVPAAQPFYPLRPPFRLNRTEVIGAGQRVMNLGDVDAYPVWQIFGPGGDARFVHTTTGREFTIKGTRVAGDNVIVNTEDLTVTKNGSNAWPLLAPAPSLFPLRSGLNVLDLMVDAATSGTIVTATFQVRRKIA